MPKNHKWKNEVCTICKCSRQKTTIKTRMAIVGGRDIFQYEKGYIYTTVSGKKTYTRPECKDTILKNDQ